MERKFLFRDLGEGNMGFGGLGVCLPRLVMDIYEYSRAPVGSGFSVDWLYLGFFTLFAALAGWSILSWLNEGVLLSPTDLEFCNRFGRITKRIPYGEIDSFRREGFSKQARYFAVITGREKIIVPARMADFEMFATQLRKRHYGSVEPLPRGS